MTMDVIDFGRALIETEDLDPSYVMLWKAELEPAKLRRWLVAYFCFYHCGTASWIVDQPDYWEAMNKAADSKEWPRGSERRHFRGGVARRAMDGLQSNEFMLDAFDTAYLRKRVLTLKNVSDHVRGWPEFGPWIAFKVADILERINLLRVNFTEADTFLFDSPRKGAELVLETYGPKTVEKKDAPKWAFDYLMQGLRTLKAPPRYERTVNGQELETVLCKWSAHVAGRYPVGHDIHEIRTGLLKFSKCKTAQRLVRCLPLMPKEKPQH